MAVDNKPSKHFVLRDKKLISKISNRDKIQGVKCSLLNDISVRENPGCFKIIIIFSHAQTVVLCTDTPKSVGQRGASAPPAFHLGEQGKHKYPVSNAIESFFRHCYDAKEIK